MFKCWEITQINWNRSIQASDGNRYVLTINASFVYFKSLSSWKWTFPEGLGGSLSHLWKFRRGGETISYLQKWKIKGGGGVLSEIPSMVGVWMFSGTTHLAIFRVWQELIFAIRIDWFFLLGISFCNFRKVPSTVVCVPYIKPVFHCTPLCFWTKDTSCNWTDMIC